MPDLPRRYAEPPSTEPLEQAGEGKENRKLVADQELNTKQREMVEIWERHMAAEFAEKSIDATMATMKSDPFVNHVPVTGIEASRKVVDPAHEPSNRLIKRVSG